MAFTRYISTVRIRNVDISKANYLIMHLIVHILLLPTR